MEFDKQYGPWAIIAGASEGTGREFAIQIAKKGIPSLLIARREAPLNELVTYIKQQTGVTCISACIDLSSDNAFETIVSVIGDREVGLFVGNAGADPNGSHFLNKPIENWISLVNRNLLTTMQCCHHFGGLMRARGRGGLILVGSGAGYGGGSYMATYSAAKAFDICFSESLWRELKPEGINVLHLVLTTTDTPAFRKLLQEKGKKPPRMLASPEKVVAVALQHLDKGPIYNWGQLMGLRAWWRRTRVNIVSAISAKMVFDD